jgi:hypothetical protein
MLQVLSVTIIVRMMLKHLFFDNSLMEHNTRYRKELGHFYF